jgi:hypothetical protein
MLSVVNNIFVLEAIVLNAIMLSVIMLIVVAPTVEWSTVGPFIHAGKNFT